MSLSGILDMGRRALELAQMRVQTTAHNISHADTDGYSRQEVFSAATRPQLVPGGFLGTGARPESIQRITSSFLEHQLLTEKQARGQLDLLSTAASHIAEVLSESQVGGLSESLSAFFSAWNELAVTPEGVAERQAVVANGQALVRQFSLYAEGIDRVAVDMRSDLNASVSTVNDITAQIADTNRSIVSSEAGGNNANDLRDTRDALLGRLSNLTELSVVESGDPLDFTVQVKGQTLVQGAQAQQIEVVNDANGLPTLAVLQGSGSNPFFDLPERGRIGAALQVIRSDIPDVQAGLNEVAVFLAANVNANHAAGYALDGTTGHPFFTAPLTAGAGNSNTGGAAIGAPAVVDGSAFTGHGYEITFTAADTYQVVDTTSGATVIPAAAGNYTSGATIAFDGVEVAVTNGGGAPANGDTFSVVPGSSYYTSMRVDSTLVSNPQLVVASATAAGLPGDNETAMAIADLATSGTMGGGSTTLTEAISGMVSQAGVDSAQAQKGLERQDLVVSQVQAQRDAVSGVSTDGEAANLVEFQRSYQAAAKVIATADKMLETLLNM